MEKYKILVVDDNMDNSDRIMDFLNETEKIFTFFQAPNGKLASVIAEKKLPDLIITDWEMPIMDGIELIKCVKSNAITTNIPIIMCTGVMTTTENLKTALDAGAADYIRKPVEKLELIARVHSMLKLSDSMKKIKEQNIDLTLQKEEILQQKEEIITTLETLNEQKEEIEQQTEKLKETNLAIGLAYSEIHKKNENITASINYAKHIQNAILPFADRFEQSFGKDNFFVLFQPKDIVSGDFYWLEEIQNVNEKITFIAVADCTGHGVPGAFMSMIGNQLLYEIILKNQIYSPELILNQLHKEVHRVLHQKETNTNDGMDMIMLVITEDSQNFKQIISYSGAMNPLYYVQNDEFIEIKATKKAIGGRQIEKEHLFEKHEIQRSDDQELTFYLCTDGFQDQFGGENKRKFMAGAFKKLLHSISEKPMKEQEKILSKTLENWIKTGNEKQIDDVSILGIKIN
ncbi:MAG: response regulator [Bacteroidetes bacterium]|nr:MAG: response regulator [Bacteroidota bacterium]